MPDIPMDDASEDAPIPKKRGLPVVQTDQEFRDMLIQQLNKYKEDAQRHQSENEKLHRIITDQQGTIRFLQEQVQQLQSMGKIDGNHYDAPDTLTVAAEPINPIGFGRVRSMYPNGLPDVVHGTSHKAAA
ncbi:hypothetical protein [Hymenobacter fodinae]|uniref:Uncharacterized protein n=1 Tax=Hymenobacter fodinae TaxID=2510796 RepID=A0A4Z0P2G9_9BACT|nr:hypothetical protein [Hymenobacter fodinae]TGE05612.1 hypothetical protein EU556_20130 [Hymenobacter fodinae]